MEKGVGINWIEESDKPQVNIPNPDLSKDERIYIEALNHLGKGREYAVEYHNLITAILIIYASPRKL
jgi:hypothetical protein